jgi:hypothetical protein
MRGLRIGHADQRSGLVWGRGCAALYPARRFDDAVDFEPSCRSEAFLRSESTPGDTVGSIDISDDVKAHIRSLRTQRALIRDSV